MRGDVGTLMGGVALLLLVGATKGAPGDVQASGVASGAEWQVQEFLLKEVWRSGGVDAPEEMQFAGPYLVLSFSPDGHAYVLDQSLSTVTELDGTDGSFVRRFGRPGRGPGELSAAAAMDWDAAGRLWIAASFDGRYTVFDSTGALLKTALRPAHATSRWVFPLTILPDGSLLDHVSAFPRVRFQRVDTLGAVQDSFSIAHPPADQLTGIIRPGSALKDVLQLRPSLKWAYARDGRSVWVARSDSLTLTQLSLNGDTVRVIRHQHRTARFTADQRESIAKANRELGREGRFVPVVLRALHTMEDGRVLAQIATDKPDLGSEFDVFGPDGRLLGTVKTPLRVHSGSEISSRGDTLLLPGLGEFDVPVVVKAVLQKR